MVGSLADLGTAAEVGSPAAGEGPAGMVPAAGCIGRYLWGASVRNVNESPSKDDTTRMWENNRFFPVTFHKDLKLKLQELIEFVTK